VIGINQRSVLFVAMAAIMWGFWSLITRLLEVSVWTSTPLIFLTMGVLALPLALRDATPAKWSRRVVVFLILNGVFAAGNVITYFAAINETTVAVAVLSHYVAPIIVAVLAPYVDGERIPGAPLAALVAGFGLVLILEPWAASSGRGSVHLGAALGAVSATFFAGNVFMARRLEPAIGAMRTISYHALIAAVVLLPFIRGDVTSISAQDIGLIAAGAALPGALAGVLFVVGLARIGSSRSAVLAYLEPLVAVILGWLIWREALGLLAIAGAGCIVAAGIWVAREPRTTRP